MTITLTTGATTTTRRLSGFKPTGRLHLGNYLGAIRPMLDAARSRGDDGPDRMESVVMIADLHALTVEHDPDRLRTLTTQMLATLLASGVDERSIYVQSDVPEHAELHYLLECATGYGEAARMVQFKTRAAGTEPVRLSLLTYPVLMAADILLHDATEVPVGEDQTQHLELARDVANRFNTRYGRTFVVPRAVHPPTGARVMDLADPSGKMGKSSVADSGLIYLLDKPELVRRKVFRAVTDGLGRLGGEGGHGVRHGRLGGEGGHGVRHGRLGGEGGDAVHPGGVGYDPDRRPAVSNLVEILAACTREDPALTALRYGSYAALKEALTEAIVDTLAPVQRRYAELIADRGYLDAIRQRGAARARDRAAGTVARAKHAIGLTP